MRRRPFLVPLLALALFGALALAGFTAARAQDATPIAGEDFVPEGLGFQPLGFGIAEQLPAAPVELGIIRITFKPGSGFPIEPSDPAAALVYVESGELTFATEVTITVTRAATIAAFTTPPADPASVPMPEEIPAGTQFTMAAGDSAYFPPSISGEVRNAGQEPAAILIANIDPMGDDAVGTPAP